MSLPPAYASLLNELNRDIIRSAPSDPLQFCASWFFSKLEQDRIRARAAQSQLINDNNHSHLSAPSPLDYHHHPHFPLPPPPPPLSHTNPYSICPALSHHHHLFPPPTSHHQSPSAVHQSYHYHSSIPSMAHYPPYQSVTPQPCFFNPPSSHQFSARAPAHHDHLNNINIQQSQPPPPPLPQQQQQHQQQPPSQPRPYSFGRPNGANLSTNLSQPQRYSTRSPASVSPIPQSSRDLIHPHQSSRHTPIGASSQHQRQPNPVTPNSSAPTYREGINSPRAIFESAGDESDDDELSNEPIVPAGYNFGRRISVSAESLSPSNLQTGPPPPKTVIPKTVEQRTRIEASIRDNLLFRNLDEEQYNDVLNAMSEVRVAKGTEVIVQGAVGDFFYVVEEGTFDVYVRGPPTYTYIPPSINQAQGTLSLGNNSNALNLTNPFGGGSSSSANPTHNELSSSTSSNTTTTITGTTLTTQGTSKKVHSYGPGGSFGELALMYNAPRAATVVATSPSATLWALDRVTFRSILMEHTSRKRKMYESFLSEVPILVSLSAAERSKIADTLEERSFNEGVEVIREGEVGREFFIIESGRAEVSKKRANGEEETVGILGKGDHFGELALLNSAPRAATVRAATGSGKLKVAALGEKAFTRLLGPVVDILSRHAESHYGQHTNNHHPQQQQQREDERSVTPIHSPHSAIVPPPPGSRVSATGTGGSAAGTINGGSNSNFGNWSGLTGNLDE